MRVGELWWMGREDAFGTKLDLMAPACLSMEQAFKSSIRPSSKFREGIAFDADVFETDHSEEVMVSYSQWKASMEAMIAATESTVRAQASVDKLRATLVDFRGAIKNDLSSMKAASERVQNEVLQMQEKYRQAQAMLTTPEFMQAIQNAERMATALKAIQDLTETKISVAVFGAGKEKS